jgi:hypothetical protein
MANAYIDKITMAQVIGTAYDTSTVRALRPQYIFDAVCREKEWDLNTNPTKGDTMIFTTLAAWSSNTGALDPTTSTISGSQTLTHTRRSVSLTLYGDHAILDVMEMKKETFIDSLADAAFNMTDMGMNSLNKLARAAIDLNKFSNETSGTISSTYHYYGSSGTATNIGPMRAIDIRSIVSDLRGANVRPFDDGNYMCIINPVQYTQLRADSDNASWSDIAESGVSELAKEIAKAHPQVFEQCRFVINTEVLGAGSNTVTAYIVGREGCGKAIGHNLRVRTKSTLDGSHESLLTMFWDFLGGYKIIRREAIRTIQTSGTKA